MRLTVQAMLRQRAAVGQRLSAAATLFLLPVALLLLLLLHESCCMLQPVSCPMCVR